MSVCVRDGVRRCGIAGGLAEEGHMPQPRRRGAWKDGAVQAGCWAGQLELLGQALSWEGP